MKGEMLEIKKLDELGIEPRAFPMRRERDTTTPHTRRYLICNATADINLYLGLIIHPFSPHEIMTLYSEYLQQTFLTKIWYTEIPKMINLFPHINPFIFSIIFKNYIYM